MYTICLAEKRATKNKSIINKANITNRKLNREISSIVLKDHCTVQFNIIIQQNWVGLTPIKTKKKELIKQIIGKDLMKSSFN